MTLIQLKQLFQTSLIEFYPTEEIDSFYNLVIESILLLKRIDVALDPNRMISDVNLNEINAIIEKLSKEIPIQYILGETEFFGLKFKVNAHVLIPRQETEELVAWIIEETKGLCTKNEPRIIMNILDIGTGTGCIPISLAKNIPNAQVASIDISIDALNVAKENATNNKASINFIEQDILKLNNFSIVTNSAKQSAFNEQDFSSNSHHNKAMKFEVIVSNPPYVRELEKQEINSNVLNNEPHLALFVNDNNALVFYDKIADLAKESLSENGKLFFEINQYLGNETVLLLKNKGYSKIELRKDLNGNDRMIMAKL